MDWRRAAPRGRSAEAEESIQYLRRYLEDTAPRRGSLTSGAKDNNNNNNNNNNSVVAAGVLPASAARADRGAGEHTLGSTSPRRRYEHTSKPGFEGLHNSNKNSSISSPVHAGGGGMHTRSMTSSSFEPLRLRYGNASSSMASGRPPFHHHQNNNNNNNNNYRDDMAGDGEGGLKFEKSISRHVNNDDSLRRERRQMHGDPHGEPRLNNSVSSSNYRSSHPHPHSDPNPNSHMHRSSPYTEEKARREERSSNINVSREEGMLPLRSRTPNPTRGVETRRHHAGRNVNFPDGAMNTSTPESRNPGVQKSPLNRRSTSSSRKRKKHTCSIDVFPYPKHEDNLRSILCYLKNHYALEPEEFRRGIETMTPEDVLGLAQCFYVDSYRTVRHARNTTGVGRAGFTDSDPPLDCLVGSPREGEPPTRGNKPSDDDDDSSDGDEEEEEEERGTLVAPPPPTLPPSNDLTPNHHHYSRLQSRSVTSGMGGRGGATQTPHVLSYPSRSQRSVEHPAAEPTINASGVTESTLFPLEAPVEPSSGIVKRPLRELMPLLRRGSNLCKHVENGRPHMRFFRVEDHVGEYCGEQALMPHLVWYPTATDQRPSQALKLLSLLAVHLLVSDDGGQFRKLFHRRGGVVVDHSRRPVANGMCAFFRFEKRDVAVSFLTEEDRQLWVGGMMGIVEKNKVMTSRLHLQ